MKYFLLRILLFALMIWSSFWVLDAWLPYYWGNAGIASKMEYLEGKRADYNVFFMGSSRVYRQLMPDVFDEEMMDDIRSFNLGYRATFNPESYYLLEHFIRKKAAKRTYILMELQPFVPIANRNLHTVSSNYYLDYQYFSLVKKHYKNEQNLSDSIRNSIVGNYRKSYIGNVLKTRHVREMGLGVLGQGDRDGRALGERKNGFHSLDESAVYSKSLVERRARFWEKYDTTKSCFEGEKKSYEMSLSKKETAHTAHLNKINQLIKSTDQQGYTLIFFLPPKRSELLPLFLQIDAQHRIDMARPDDYPFLYENNLWFDPKHFNEKGAALFTKELAKRFELIK